MKHELPELGYGYGALEPFVDEETMRIHHSKHHQAYVDKLNAALEGQGELQSKPLGELLRGLDSVPEKIRTAVRNHGGGHWNHSFFWPLLKKGVKPEGEIKKAIENSFGSFEEFKKQFSQAAAGVFGSGWTWLVKDAGKLRIVSTPNQDSPISQGLEPLLCLDVWEHAYYIKYRNKRPDYIEAFFSVINWEKVSELLKKG